MAARSALSASAPERDAGGSGPDLAAAVECKPLRRFQAHQSHSRSEEALRGVAQCFCRPRRDQAEGLFAAGSHKNRTRSRHGDTCFGAGRHLAFKCTANGRIRLFRRLKGRYLRESVSVHPAESRGRAFHLLEGICVKPCVHMARGAARELRADSLRRFRLLGLKIFADLSERSGRTGRFFPDLPVLIRFQFVMLRSQTGDYRRLRGDSHGQIAELALWGEDGKGRLEQEALFAHASRSDVEGWGIGLRLG